MRLLLLIAIIGGLLPLAGVYPHVGLLVWSWFTLMQPHREAWDLPPWLQLNLVVALVTIVAWLISREPKLPRASALPVMVALLCFWMVLSQIYSLRPQYSWTYFDRDIRVIALIVLSLIMLINRSRIHAMIWIIVISVGYYGVAGGILTIVSGGTQRIFGPPE